MLFRSKSKLESGSDIYKDEALGEILNTLIISYFAKFKQNTNKIASMSEIYYHSTPSIGWAHTFMSRDSLFGVTKSVKTTDMIIDVVDRIITLSYDGDFEKLKTFHQTEGALGSFWEGNIFSEMIPDVINPISTVHLMMEAAILGQTIYTLNKDTYSTLMPYITGLGEDTRKHIIDAILAGHEVCIHSAPITRGTWRGFGYSVIDPVMKTGSYNIEGGANGGGTGFDTSAQTLSPFSSAFLVNSANTPIQAASLLSKEKVLIDIIVTIISQCIILWICSAHEGKSIDINKCSDCCIYADCGLIWSIIFMIIGVVTALSPLKPVGILLVISALSSMYYYYQMDNFCASLKNDDGSTCVCKKKKNDS